MMAIILRMSAFLLVALAIEYYWISRGMTSILNMIFTEYKQEDHYSDSFSYYCHFDRSRCCNSFRRRKGESHTRTICRDGCILLVSCGFR